MAREGDISGAKIAEIMEAMDYYGAKAVCCMKLLGWHQNCMSRIASLDFAVRNSLVTELRIFFKCREQGYVDQAGYCLMKAIKADPKDVTFRGHLARLFAELGHYQRAALKAAAKFYKKCGRQVEYSVRILEDYMKSQPDGANASVVDLLGTILMETKAHDRALQHIEQAQAVNARKELPLNLKIKAGICHAHLGNMEMAQVLFNDLKPEKASKHVDLVTEAADSLVGLEHYNPALNYYLMLEGNIEKENVR
ncbi:hypothetical protein JHK82_043328 [Glycine max]|nr:hypothetical protein JHK82_043328 [Glycine max]